VSVYPSVQKFLSVALLFATSPLWGAPAIQLPFRLDSNSEVVALQFDVTTDVPGIELTANEAIVTSTGHSIASAPITPTTTRFIIHNPDNGLISDGALVEVTIGLLPSLGLNDLSLSFSNPVFANSDGTHSLASIVVPPLVEMRNPSSARSYPIERSLILKVDAVDADGVLANVEFLIDGSGFKEDSSFPYEASWDPPSEGSYTVKVVVTDSDGLSAETAEIPVTVFSLSDLQSYDNFKAIYFPDDDGNSEIVDPASDPDGDAISNLLEYFLSLDPVEADAQLGPVFYLTEEEGTQFLVLQFTRLTASRDLNYSVESTGDMKAWAEQLDFVRETTDNGDGTATVVVKVPIEEGSSFSNFLRLQVTND